jgi:hypothetical protein
MEAGRLLTRPYIPLLHERHARTGFFERDQREALVQQLPVHMRGIAAFAYLTGWRTLSEILPLEWRQGMPRSAKNLGRIGVVAGDLPAFRDVTTDL